LTTEEYYDELYRIMFEQLKLMTGINPGLKIEKHSLDVTPSNDIIKYVTDKIIKRSKQIKVLNNTSGVFDFNIAKTEELINQTFIKK
jgi:hypothetical protein